ncbi:hypothetical protein OIE52_39575 [Streptomyces canus]|uniref:hypothetical protein n=1 Tax=Streptomyces canus TaxID=58343 RepID=UPI00324DE29B
MKPDPRARQLAEAVHEIARQKATKLPAWPDLSLADRDKVTAEARLWLRAAIETGIAPASSTGVSSHRPVPGRKG